MTAIETFETIVLAAVGGTLLTAGALEALNYRRHYNLSGFTGDNGEEAYSTTLGAHRYVEVGQGRGKIYARIRSFPIALFRPNITYIDTDEDGHVERINEDPGLLQPAKRLRLNRWQHGKAFEERFRQADQEFQMVLSRVGLVLEARPTTPGKVTDIKEAIRRRWRK